MMHENYDMTKNKLKKIRPTVILLGDSGRTFYQLWIESHN